MFQRFKDNQNAKESPLNKEIKKKIDKNKFF